MGAKVIGYSLAPKYERCIYNTAHVAQHIHADIQADLRDRQKLEETLLQAGE
jgi:hypothetical protein